MGRGPGGWTLPRRADPRLAACGDAPLDWPGSRRGVKRGGWRLALTPIVLLAVTAAILWWVNHGELQPGESALLSTSNLRARAWEHVQMSAVSTALATLVAVPLGIVMS